MDDEPISIDLPNTIECVVKSTDAVVKGQTAASSYKPATLENGVNIWYHLLLKQVKKLF